MQIDGSGSLYNLANLVSGATTATGGNSAASGAQYDPARAVLGDAFARASDLGSSLDQLDRLISTAQPGRTRRTLAASAAPLNLTGVSGLTATTLRSGEQVNATATSFSPFGPAYSLPTTSTALPTLEGIYDATNGTQTIEFRSRSDGVHIPGNGGANVRFRLYDGDGNRLRDPDGKHYDEILIKRQDPIDQQYAVGNGLLLTLGVGTVADGDSFFVDLYHDVGSAVDPDKALNGLRNDNPNLEYGLAVINGSFDINGVNITVNASDSINDVLARITASAADVTATFDIATEQILLSRNTPGAAFDISLANDNSGFLQATKLDNPLREPGTEGNTSTLLRDLPQFAAVVSGTFRVNGVDIALDVTTDSLADVLARIDASGTNVRTSLVQDRVFLEASRRKDAMILENGGTGLFDALNIGEGRYKPATRDGIALERALAIASNVGEATAATERLLSGGYGGGSVPAAVAQLQARVRSVLEAAESGLLDDSKPRFGLSFDLSDVTRPALILLDSQDLVTSLRVDFSAFRAAFSGSTPDTRDGFVRQLLDVVNQFTEALRNQAGSAGFLRGLSA